MNLLDKQYQELLKTILEHGIEKKDRTGTGTKSIFGYTIRHNMSEGFPLLTTKKMAWKTMVTELLWFLRGDTNIKYLVDNGCHIWNGDCYKNFYKKSLEIKLAYESGDLLGGQPHIDAMFSNSNELIILSEEEFINKIKTDDGFARRFGGLGPIYGKQWRNWVYGKDMDYGTERSVDQIQNLIHDLKTNPDSRRLMVSAWNVGELDQMVLPPCHYGFQVYTRELSFDERRTLVMKGTGYPIVRSSTNWTEDEIKEGNRQLEEANIPTRAISLMWNQRSVDTFLGLPFNIASYGLLLEIIAKAVNMAPDELIGNLGDTHLYLNHIEQAKEQIDRTSFELPSLNINTEWWPTESGECGEGPLDAIAVFEGFKNENFCKCLLEEDIQLCNYQSHPSIKAPLSN
jgi:thymidylate synthase